MRNFVEFSEAFQESEEIYYDYPRIDYVADETDRNEISPKFQYININQNLALPEYKMTADGRETNIVFDLENDDFSVVGCTDTENEAEKARISSKYVSYSKVYLFQK